VITATRVLLGAMAAGCFAVVATVVPALSLQAWLNLAVWFAAAIVLHDGVLAPMLQVSGALAGRLPVPRSAVLLVEGGLLVGLLVSALAIPPLVTQHNGPANPSVVPQNYWANLGIFWALDALVVAAALVVVVRRRRGPRV
jgi:hypothetical protein